MYGSLIGYWEFLEILLDWLRLSYSKLLFRFELSLGAPGWPEFIDISAGAMPSTGSRLGGACILLDLETDTGFIYPD